MTGSQSDTTKENHAFEWKRMQFKGNKVWLALTADATPLTRAGKVRIKYNLDQSYEYWVHADSVIALGPGGEVTTPSKPDGSGSKRSSKPSKQPLKSSVPIDAIQIYTDGASSGNPGPAGAGVVLIYGKHRKEISQYLGRTTNNAAELTAVQIALSHLKTTTKPVALYTDSSYVIGMLTKGWKAKQNGSLITDIKKQMARFKTLTLIKVAGHAGIDENERADQLAVEAITNASK